MRYSQRNDQLAEGIAFVAARALWLDYISRENGPQRGREREMATLKMLLGQLAQTFPGSADEAFELAQEHHAYTVGNREASR